MNHRNVLIGLVSATLAACAARPPDLMHRPTIGATIEIQDEAPDEGEEKRNKIALFLGGTHKESDDGASVGLEYEHRLSDLVGVGLLFEVTPSLSERVVGMPTLFLHPVGDLGVLLAPGIEYEDSERVFLFRVGLSWDFELASGITLAPELNYDLVEG